MPVETHAPSAVRAAREIRLVVGRLRRRLREVYDPRDLTPSQLSALSHLAKGGPASASDLAATERVRPQSMAATLAVLAERGLVTRRPDPDDGRRQLLSLTSEGVELVEDRRRIGQEWLAEALDRGYTEAERQQILAALTLLERLT